MRFHHPVVTGIKSFIILILAAVIMYKPAVSRIRQQYMDGYIDYFEENVSEGEDGASDMMISVPDSEVFAIEGEAEDADPPECTAPDESLESLSAGVLTSTREDGSHNDSSLQLIGVIDIPSIDTKVPVWEGVSAKALRFGVGRYPLSSPLGTSNGNCFIMGHRNRHLSTIFCRLQYIKVGSSVFVTTKEGKEIEYKVAKTVAIPPEKVSDYMTATADGQSKLTLCTCITERGRGWRFIAVCISSEF